MKNKREIGGGKLKTKVVLLLILLVFAFTPIITALATTFIVPTINVISLVKATAYNVIFGIQPLGDPILDPVGPG